MSKGFRQSQAGLHTWSSLLLGWIMFVIFVAGTIAFWREGLNRWMRPELPRIEQPGAVVAAAQHFLAVKAADARSWLITVPTDRAPGAQVSWQPQPKEGEPPRRRRDTNALIGADGKADTARATRGGEFFYRFHFDLHYMPVLWARWLVSATALAMLVAILTGVVTHKKIFKDFFTLRRNKGQRSWLDGHNALAVLALPFHLMITYTGLVTLMTMTMPWAVVANYDDRTALFDALFPAAEEVERTGRAAPLFDLATLQRRAERTFGAPAGFIEVSEPGDAAARVTVTRASGSMLSSRAPTLTYDGVSGALLWRSPEPGGAALTAGAMVGLHAGRFASDGLRWLYFLAGIAGTAMIASGLVLWTVKRRERLPDPARPPFGFRLVERLNIAVIAGFPAAIAVMLWANRLLPMGMSGRAQWEVHALFIAWAAALALASLVPARRAWGLLLAATGGLCAALPLYNIAATQQGLPLALMRGDAMIAGIDMALLGFGLAFHALAARMRRGDRRPARAHARASATAIGGGALAEPAE